MTHFAVRVRKPLLFTCALATSLSLATPANATTPEEKAVLAPLQALLDGLAKRDKALVMEQLLPGGSATLMRDGKPVQLTFDVLADRITQPGTEPREERMHDPLVHIDDNVAVVWTPYVFTINGKVDHCGTDIANLVRVDGKWLIASLADTSRKDCKARH
jgi:Putative lumazine-binding